MHNSKSTAIFLVLVGILILVVAAHNFDRYYLAQDYPFHAFTACDPSAHSCFTADPANADPTFQGGPYEKVEIDAAHAPTCLEQHTCTDFSCESAGGTCAITHCSDSALEDGESCTVPAAPVAPEPAATTTEPAKK